MAKANKKGGINGIINQMNKLTSGFLQADLGPNHKDIKIKRLKKKEKAANQPMEKQRTPYKTQVPQAPPAAQQSVNERVNTTQDEIQFIKNETTMSNSHSQILDI